MGLLLKHTDGNMDVLVSTLIKEQLTNEELMKNLVNHEYTTLKDDGSLLMMNENNELVVFDESNDETKEQVLICIRNCIIVEQSFNSICVELGYEIPAGRLKDFNTVLDNLNEFVNTYENIRKNNTTGIDISEIDFAYGIYQYFDIPDEILNNGGLDKETLDAYHKFVQDKINAKENYLQKVKENSTYLIDTSLIEKALKNLYQN